MIKNILSFSARGIALALTLSALSAPVAAQPQDVSLTLQPDSTDPTLIGNNIGAASQEPNVTSVTYKVPLDQPYQVSISAQLYDNNFPGTFLKPREIAIDIPGFIPDKDVQIEAKRLGFVNFVVTGTLPAGDTFITVRNKISEKYRWGVKSMRVTRIDVAVPTTPVVQGPVIPTGALPSPPITPSAGIISVRNFCNRKLNSQATSPIAGYPFSVLEYGNRLVAAANGGRISQTDRGAFFDYLNYSDIAGGTGSYLRQNIGKTDNNLLEIALLQLPGGTAQESDELTFWCPSDCPTGYTQIAVQCNVTQFDTSAGRLRNVLPGYSSQNVCAYDVEGYESYNAIPTSERLNISTTVSCARNVEPYQYNNAQGSIDWPRQF